MFYTPGNIVGPRLIGVAVNPPEVRTRSFAAQVCHVYGGAIAGARSLINRDRCSHMHGYGGVLHSAGRTMYIPDWSRVGPACARARARGIRQPCNRINTPSSRNEPAEHVTNYWSW